MSEGPHRTGFTLAELLVALGLFGLIAAASVMMLAMGINTREATQQTLDRQAALLRARALLGADLGQAVPRRTRDLGGRAVPAFTADPGAGLLFSLTRAGWSNPDAAPRPSLQRVEYRLVGGRLERRAAAMLDGAPLGPPAILLDGLDAVRVRFSSNGGWQDRWPAAEGIALPDALPDAVEITVESSATGTLVQLFALPPGVRP